MSTTLDDQLIELSKLTGENCANRGRDVVSKGEEACKPLVLWLQYLRANHSTGTADSLLEATACAAREAIACLALGLVRPALASLRAQIDMCLAWLYFKDHPVEWQRVQDTGDGFQLKSDVLKYLTETVQKHKSRSGLLRDCKTRQLDDPFRLLSAHIHGQSEMTLPAVNELKDIVATPAAQNDVLRLQAECSEFINDLFWSVFADRWASIPIELQRMLDARFKSSAQRAAFYA
jgi:hypothetical protein